MKGGGELWLDLTTHKARKKRPRKDEGVEVGNPKGKRKFLVPNICGNILVIFVRIGWDGDCEGRRVCLLAPFWGFWEDFGGDEMIPFFFFWSLVFGLWLLVFTLLSLFSLLMILRNFFGIFQGMLRT